MQITILGYQLLCLLFSGFVLRFLFSFKLLG